MLRVLVVGLLFALLPVAVAGSQDAPEVTDPQGDATCFGPLGNEYADIVSAWIDGETATSFMVHIALAKVTDLHLATASGYTLQFTHQGVQFGAIAAYIPEPIGGGWEYDNGYIDTASGELGDFRDAEGSFTPGTPAIISIEFDKGLFPHGDSADNRLVDLNGGSADFKNWAPFFVAPMDPPTPFQVCDSIESSATYEFQLGGHSAGSSSADSASGETTTTEDASSANGTARSTGPEIDDVVEPNGTGNDTPFVPVAAALAVIAAVAALRRRK